ncbi:hypothetical protein HNO89_003746 [Sporosarcina luteola]|nr:hypothetical protein [Sporosarcina luteola]
MRKFVLALGFMSFVMMMTACGSDKPKNEAAGNDGSQEENNEDSMQQQVEIKDLEVIEYGYERDTDGYLQVAGIFKNPNEEHTAKSAHINWTITGENDVVIAEPASVKTIRPGETVVMSFPAIQHEEFQDITVELEVKEDDWLIEEAPLVTASDISLTDITVEKDFYEAYVITGFIENTSEHDIASVDVGIVFKKDGKIVGGSTSELYSPMKAGHKYEFKRASSIAFPEMDDYEIYFYNIEVQ